MLNYVNVISLLLLTTSTICLTILLKYTQKDLIAKLEAVLLQQNNPKQYFELLRKKHLVWLLRKGSYSLLELNGYLYNGDKEGAQYAFHKLDNIRLNSYEKLSYYQKKMNYFINNEQYKEAVEVYVELEKSFLGETDKNRLSLLKDTGSRLERIINE